MKKYPTTRATWRYTICITRRALKGGEVSSVGRTCPLTAALCFVPWRLPAPQLISEPYTLSQPGNPRQSWTRASLRLVSVQTKFGGPGIVTFQAPPELLHRDSAGMNPSFMGKTGHISCSRHRHRLAL